MDGLRPSLMFYLHHSLHNFLPHTCHDFFLHVIVSKEVAGHTPASSLVRTVDGAHQAHQLSTVNFSNG